MFILFCYVVDMKDIIKDCFKHNPLIKYFTEQDLFNLEQNTVQINYRQGENIFKQGAPFTHVVLIRSGYTKMFIEGYNKNLILAVIPPGELISGPGMWVDNLHHFCLAALTEVEACLIELDVFKTILRDNADFSENFRRNHSITAIRTFDKIISLTQNHMSGRVAEVLLVFSRGIFRSKKFNLLLSRQELAEITSLSKESVCRILKEFTNEALIKLEDDEVEILDMDRLQQISRNG